MNLDTIETIILRLGGLLAFTALGIVLYGVWRGTQRQAGRTSGRAGGWLRSWWFYLITTLIFIGIAIWAWKPVPQTFSTTGRVWVLVLGSLLYFAGLVFVLWGRLMLGKNYFVSSGIGAQLFEGHQLITSGPYAIVRHPMYFGLFIMALGSLLLYHTWTTLFFASFVPLTVLRARREELLLAEEFGTEWQEYCKRVPQFFPRVWRKKT